MERKQDVAMLLESVELAQRQIADIGCGLGGLARLLAEQGAASVVGIDPGAEAIAAARSVPHPPQVRFLAGFAEALPLPDSSLDLAVFFNSFHHIPAEVMLRALSEAARVLAPGGLLYVSEPVAEGSHFALVRPVDDETEIRAAAYGALRRAEEPEAGAFESLGERLFLHESRYPNFAAFKARMLAVDPGRAERFAALEDGLQESFLALGRQSGEHFVFDQPMRAMSFRRP